MSNANANVIPFERKDLVESLVLKGDMSGLTPQQKVQYYMKFCERLGLDPLSQPFKLLKLKNKEGTKEILYCDRGGTQQLNKLHSVSHQITAREFINDLYVVTARACLPDGRHTDSIGVVPLIDSASSADRANALMKAETKAKRRATLDLIGLGWLDESEIETIPGAQTEPISTTYTYTSKNGHEKNGNHISFEELKAKIEQAEHLEHLQNIWRKYQEVMKGFSEEQKAELIKWKDEKKKALSEECPF